MNFSGEHDRLGLTRMQASLLEPIGLGRAPDFLHGKPRNRRFLHGGGHREAGSAYRDLVEHGSRDDDFGKQLMKESKIPKRGEIYQRLVLETTKA